jgi:hypothetical protein
MPATSKYYDFQPLDRERALRYHLMFHHSLALHINHMIFLHTFLFGVLLCSSLNAAALISVTAAYTLYASIIIRPAKFYFIYILVPGILALSAVICEDYISTKFSTQKWLVGAAGSAIILSSFAFQLMGHALHEELFAPPNIFHGFLAAPILEFQCFIFRMRYVDASEYDSIMEVVNKSRNELKESLEPHRQLLD